MNVLVVAVLSGGFFLCVDTNAFPGFVTLRCDLYLNAFLEFRCRNVHVCLRQLRTGAWPALGEFLKIRLAHKIHLRYLECGMHVAISRLAREASVVEGFISAQDISYDCSVDFWFGGGRGWRVLCNSPSLLAKSAHTHHAWLQEKIFVHMCCSGEYWRFKARIRVSPTRGLCRIHAYTCRWFQSKSWEIHFF